MNLPTNTGLFSQAFERLNNCMKSGKLRLKATAFVRERQFGAANILRLILYRIYKPLQLALDDYCELVKVAPMSKQAFSKARQQLNPDFVRGFADDAAALIAKDDSMPTYKGMRLIAIDGTDIALEDTAELKMEFGCSGPLKDAATALASIAYGPLDHIIYDSRIDRYSSSERDLAVQHVQRLTEIGLKGKLAAL